MEPSTWADQCSARIAPGEAPHVARRTPDLPRLLLLVPAASAEGKMHRRCRPMRRPARGPGMRRARAAARCAGAASGDARSPIAAHAAPSTSACAERDPVPRRPAVRRQVGSVRCRTRSVPAVRWPVPIVRGAQHGDATAAAASAVVAPRRPAPRRAARCRWHRQPQARSR